MQSRYEKMRNADTNHELQSGYWKELTVDKIWCTFEGETRNDR